MNLENLFESFIREKAYIQNCAPSTIHYFRQCFKAYRRMVQQEEVTRQTVIDFVVTARQQGMSVGCLNTYIKGINSFLCWLHENEFTTERLKIKLLPRPAKKVLRSFTNDELKRIMDYKPKGFTSRRIHSLALTLMDTGCRIDELLSLTRQQVSFDNLVIKVKGKGNKERIVPMSLELRKALLRWLKTHEYDLVFPAKSGVKLDYNNAHHSFFRFLRRLGIEPIGFHALRRTFAKNYLRHGGNLIYLRAILGHSRVETTERYVEVEADALQETHAKTSLLSRCHTLRRKG